FHTVCSGLFFIGCPVEAMMKGHDCQAASRYWQKNGTHLAALPLHSGNALPLFWHCRLAAACGPCKHWLLQHGTPIALSVTTESGQPAKVSRNEHQLR
ncbi:hypothetical protein, partial [Pseudomonas syringae]